MALPNVVKGEVGRVIAITWTKSGSSTAEDISGATLTGKIQGGGSTRDIAGALAITDGASGQFTWTLAAADTATEGNFLVHFVATTGGVILKTFPANWLVIGVP